MAIKLTRRDWAAAAMSSTAVLAQAPAPPASAPAKETPDQLLAEARRQVARNRETLEKYSVKMATEPAFQFKA